MVACFDQYIIDYQLQSVHTNLQIRYQIVGHIKETVSLTDLCTTHPPQFKEFLFYTRRLKYQQVIIDQ